MMTKKQLKESLSGLSNAQLISMILDLSSIREVKSRLSDRFMDEKEREKQNKALYEAAREGVRKAFYPARLHIAKGCVSKSTKAITQFKESCSDMDLLAELLVFQTELISVFFRELEGELYYNSMVNTAERNVKFLVRNGYVDRYMPHLKTVLKGIEGDFNLVE